MQSLEIAIPLDTPAPAEPALAETAKSIDASMPRQLQPSSYCRWKPWIGRLLAAALLVPGAPLIGLLVILVRVTSRGVGIYSQKRVGIGGREYTMYKIRTMLPDAECGCGPVWYAGEGDPRVTRLGRWLRKLHMDELPQLWNVVRGEMVLIGPRPERPEFVGVLAKSIPHYRDRLLLAPGITGLAQINLPPDTDLLSVRRKLVLDCEYIASATPFLDIRILASTALRLVGIPGYRAMRLMRLQRNVVLPGDEVSCDSGDSLPRVFAAEMNAKEANKDAGRAAARAAKSNGATPNGATHNGAPAHNGTAHNGTAHNGAAHNGTAHGAAPRGAMAYSRKPR